MGFSVAAQNTFYLLAGTYTGDGSEGIYVYEFDAATGKAKLVDSVAASNPSYLVPAANGKFVYAVNEDAKPNVGGGVSAFSFNKKNGRIFPLNQQPSQGDHPCYISIDQTGNWVAAGNYSSGTAAVFPVVKNGALGSVASTVAHQGKGSVAGRQDGPHVHATVFAPDNQFLFVSDLGIDKICSYRFNQKNGALTPFEAGDVQLPAGSGPRHLVFHNNSKWAYLISEIGGNVTALNYKNGLLKAFQTVSSLPAGVANPSTSADIHVSPDGRFLYASNRDPVNDIAIFSINQKNGTLTPAGHQAVMGSGPRNFILHPTGKYLLVANQNSNNIVVMKRNATTGQLTNTGYSISLSKPVCLQWISK